MPDTQELRQRYEKLYSGVVYDALTFDLQFQRPLAVDQAIKPAWAPPTHRVTFGHAFTCRGRLVLHTQDIDDTVRIKMFREFTPGCVQVLDAGQDCSVAHFGDISGRIARKFGCVGAVIDGNTRDVALLERDGFMVYCRAVQPVDAFGRWQIVEYQTEIALRGIQGPVSVRPTDFIFADNDGVLVVPGEVVDDVCSCAEKRLRREDMVRERLRTTDDVQGLYDEIGRW